MNEIYERAPTRVDLAGGTLDCWPLYLLMNSPVVVNVAIDVFTHCWLEPRSGASIELWSEDLAARKSYSDLAEALADTDPGFSLLRAHLAYWKPKSGFLLRTKSESPIGGGLGGSSSLCIAIIKVFSRWLAQPLETHKAALIASHIEAQVLRKPTGTQDYFPPLLGGLCFIDYGVEGPQAISNALPKGLFEGRFVLAYTGRSHHSGINNWQVIKSALDGDEKTMASLEMLADIARDMRATCENETWTDLPALFEREYCARTALSAGFSSPEIQKLQEAAASVGAVAKICGAGGGGCVMIWCPERQENEARRACESAGFQTLSAHPWEHTA